MFLLAVLVAAAPPAVLTHNVEVDYRGVPIDVEYRSAVTVRTRQLSTAPVTRVGTPRCAWTATIDVERHVSRTGSAGVFSRPLAEARTISGSHGGSCAKARKSIDRTVAARIDELQDHLVAVAAKDGATLLAELDTVRGLSAN